MGGKVALHILPGRIDPVEWERVFGEAMGLASAFPGGLATMVRQHRSGAFRWILTSNIVIEGRQMSFLGDLETRRWADSFSIPRQRPTPGVWTLLAPPVTHFDSAATRDSGVCPVWVDPPGGATSRIHVSLSDRAASSDAAVPWNSRSVCGGDSVVTKYSQRDPDAEKRAADIVLVNGKSADVLTVFNGDTCEYPYLRAVLALGALYESRFQGAAMVTGDFAPESCQSAVEWANKNLETTIQLPVVCDGNALMKRLEPLRNPDAREAGFDVLFCGPERERRAYIMRHRLGAGSVRRMARDLQQHQDITSDALRDMRAWLDATRDVEGLVDACCRREEGPRWEVQRVVVALAALWVLNPPAETLPVVDFLRRGGKLTLTPWPLERVFPGLDARELDAWFRPGSSAVVNALVRVTGQPREGIESLVQQARLRQRQQIEGLSQMTRLEPPQRQAQSGSTGVGITHFGSAGTSSPSVASEVGEIVPSNHSRYRSAWRARIAELKKALYQDRVPLSLKTLQGFIFKSAEQKSIVLTEGAWARLDAERDVDVLLGAAYLFSLPCDSGTVARGRETLVESGLYRALFQEGPEWDRLGTRGGGFPSSHEGDFSVTSEERPVSPTQEADGDASTDTGVEPFLPT